MDCCGRTEPNLKLNEGTSILVPPQSQSKSNPLFESSSHKTLLPLLKIQGFEPSHYLNPKSVSNPYEKSKENSSRITLQVRHPRSDKIVASEPVGTKGVFLMSPISWWQPRGRCLNASTCDGVGAHCVALGWAVCSPAGGKRTQHQSQL